MGLDIRFTQRKKNFCPHCGEYVNYTDLEQAESSGRVWYDLLKSIGYYVPEAEHDEWYGKDMELTKEAAREAYKFVNLNDAYNSREIANLIAVAMYDEDVVVVNADW